MCGDVSIKSISFLMVFDNDHNYTSYGFTIAIILVYTANLYPDICRFHFININVSLECGKIRVCENFRSMAMDINSLIPRITKYQQAYV